jgi:hypothetical protein
MHELVVCLVYSIKDRITANPYVIPHLARIGPVKRGYRHVARKARTSLYRVPKSLSGILERGTDPR